MIDDLFLELAQKSLFCMITDIMLPLNTGIVGTGYAAKKRAEAIAQDSRIDLLAAAGHTPETLDKFCLTHQIGAVNSIRQLINLPQLDLI
ncbi:MAG: hypothetical protein AAFO95_04255 [Cyanobacteria bacterium J06600_6]